MRSAGNLGSSTHEQMGKWVYPYSIYTTPYASNVTYNAHSETLSINLQ